MTTETALPDASEQLAVASDQPTTDAPANDDVSAKPEGEGEAKVEAAKPEKTEAERAVARMQRKIDRLVGQRAELRAELGNRQDLQRAPIGDTNVAQQDDSETLSLSRAELAAMVKAEAAKLAPTIKQQDAEIEHRRGVVAGLAKQWGSERFDSLAAELDEAIGGLADRSGRPKPVADAIFGSDAVAAVIEYLADEDNADEAEALARMNPMQVGRAIAKLESKLAAAKAGNKPQRSSAPAPIESVKASGGAFEPDESKMTDAQWARHQDDKRKRA